MALTVLCVPYSLDSGMQEANVEGGLVQGYLAHKKHPPRTDEMGLGPTAPYLSNLAVPNSDPQPLNVKPQTLNPEPQALHPEP